MLKGSAALKPLLDRDKLNSASQSEVAKTCVALFDYIQGLPREIQLLSLSAAFVIMSRALRFPTNDVYQAVTNLMKDPANATGVQYQFDAMKWHIETELEKEGSAHG